MPYSNKCHDSKLTIRNIYFYRWVRIVVKSACNLVMSARPPVLSLYVSDRLPLDRLLWNLMLETFMKICPENRTRISGIIHEDRHKIGHFTWRHKYFLMLSASLNFHKSPLFYWSGVRLLEYPQKCKHYADAPQCYVTRTLPTFLTFLFCVYFTFSTCSLCITLVCFKPLSLTQPVSVQSLVCVVLFSV